MGNRVVYGVGMTNNDTNERPVLRMIKTQADADSAEHATLRRTRGGEWVACGRAAFIQEAADTGIPIKIVRADGSFTTRCVRKAGAPFGEGLCYGYLVPDRPRRRRDWIDNPYDTY